MRRPSSLAATLSWILVVLGGVVSLVAIVLFGSDGFVLELVGVVLWAAGIIVQAAIGAGVVLTLARRR